MVSSKELSRGPIEQLSKDSQDEHAEVLLAPVQTVQAFKADAEVHGYLEAG